MALLLIGQHDDDETVRPDVLALVLAAGLVPHIVFDEDVERGEALLMLESGRVLVARDGVQDPVGSLHGRSLTSRLSHVVELPLAGQWLSDRMAEHAHVPAVSA